MDDMEFLTDLAEIPATHKTGDFVSCECVTDCYYMIAVLRDGENILGFRLYDMRYNCTADYSYASVEQRVREKSVYILNMAWLSDKNGDRLTCTQGTYTDYTQLSPSGEPLSHYRPLVCIGMYGDYLFVDYKGGVLREAVSGAEQYLMCACAGVANLVFELHYNKPSVASSKLPRSKPLSETYRSGSETGKQLYQLYAEDIYSSDQSCQDSGRSRIMELKTMVYKDGVFKAGTVSLPSHGLNDTYDVIPRGQQSEPWFIMDHSSVVDSSGNKVDDDELSSYGTDRFLYCFPTFCPERLDFFRLKSVPLVVLQDLTAWENFASLTQLDENCQCTYVASGGVYNPRYDRQVAIGETDVAVIPSGLSKISCAKTIVPAGTPPLSVIVTGTCVCIGMQIDSDWVLNFKATATQAYFRLLSMNNRKHLKSIYISGELEMIQNYAFCNLAGVKEIELPDSVYLLGMHCFEDCVSLEKINFPRSLQGIGMSAFCKCTQLQAIELPEGLLAIGAHAFAGCISLKTLVIPESVRVIHRKAFADCSGITNLIIKGNPRIEETAFSGCNPAVCAVASEYTSFNELKETAKKIKSA